MHVQIVDCTTADAGDTFTRSLRETGFAVLRNHPIPAAVLEKLRDDWQAFFDSDNKFEFLVEQGVGESGHSGFFSTAMSETAVGYPAKDLKEFYHVIADGLVPPGCKDSTYEYRELGFELGRELMRWLSDAMPQDIVASLSEPLPGMMSEDASVFRILHYPPLDGSEAEQAVRAAAHEDINLITLLPAANHPGLEVQDTAGNWHAVPCDPGTLVVNSGDMLQEATGGYFPSTSHRVVNPGDDIANASRISAPLFLTARFDTVLSDRYTAGEYLDERLKIISR
ncbi:MAG: 2OG-Fe(II) oxygenase family protein [Pseudomonadota bacterium]